MKYSRSFDMIGHKFAIAGSIFSGVALVCLVLPWTAVGQVQRQMEVNIKAKFAEITTNKSGGPPHWHELIGQEVMDAFAAYSPNGQPANSALSKAALSGTNSANPRRAVQVQSANAVGVLNYPQYQAILAAFGRRKGVDVLTSPEVTTESGRQAQMQAVDIVTLTNGGASAPTFSPTNLSLGPTLDVLPTVSEDGLSIHLVLMPSVTEFLGYDRPGQFVAQSTGSDGSAGVAVLPLPHFRLRQTSLNVDVWDSQTVVIGFPAVEVPANDQGTPPARKTLLVFVTATVINPDGTRYHTEEEMSRVKTSVPPPANTDSVPKK